MRRLYTPRRARLCPKVLSAAAMIPVAAIYGRAVPASNRNVNIPKDNAWPLCSGPRFMGTRVVFWNIETYNKQYDTKDKYKPAYHPCLQKLNNVIQ